MLFAPGLPDLAAVQAVCAALTKPFNFMVGIKGKSFTVAELTAAGVKRISLATSLYRAAMTGLLAAAREVKDKGTFVLRGHVGAHAGAERILGVEAGVRRGRRAPGSSARRHDARKG